MDKATLQPELNILIWTEESLARFEGTAAQLIEEGLIPADLEWPSGIRSKSWVVNGFKYLLSRTRPAWHKGPMRSWVDMDHWFLNVRLCSHDHEWRQQQRIRLIALDLAKEIRIQSPQGQYENMVSLKRYWAAGDDKAFQTFKKLVLPARKKPGRKPKATDEAATPEAGAVKAADGQT